MSAPEPSPILENHPVHNVATKVRAVEMSLFPDVKPGISEFEDEFLAFICLPSGQTMADVARPAIADAYREPAGTPWGPLWCADHDDGRINRISRNLRGIADDLHHHRIDERMINVEVGP